MERHAPGFQLVAIVLVVVGLVGLAAPPPAHAMDPQLILALASTAGAIALVVGYLIVANRRQNQKTASFEGVYACGEREAGGPMGCAAGAGPEPIAVAATAEAPMTAEPRSAARADVPLAIAQAGACPGGQVAGPMGCGGPIGSEPGYTSSASAPAQPTVTAVQGQ
jgi:hypothetical protein